MDSIATLHVFGCGLYLHYARAIRLGWVGFRRLHARFASCLSMLTNIAAVDDSVRYMLQ